MNFCVFVQLISSLDFYEECLHIYPAQLFCAIVVHPFYLYISRALLSPIYNSALEKHEDKQTPWKITMHRA